jgi:hypothetical protein
MEREGLGILSRGNERNSIMAGIRLKMGKPSVEESDYIIKNVSGAIISVSRDMFLKKSNISCLAGFKANLENDYKIKVSRPYFCAQFVIETIGYLNEDIALNWLSRENDRVAGYRYLYDFTQGIYGPMSAVQFAEEKAKEKSFDTTYMSVLGRMFDVSTESEISTYLNMQKLIDKFSNLLSEDPSGFTLLDCYENDILKKNISFPDSVDEKYYLTGVNFAKDLYKETYRLAKPFYPLN